MTRGRTGSRGSPTAVRGITRSSHALIPITIRIVASTHDAAMPPTHASSTAAASSPILSRAKTTFSSGTTVARLSAVSR